MLLLASASPARQRLLRQAGIPHRVRVSGVDEDRFEAGSPRSLVQRLAEAKARAVLEAELGEAGLEDVSAVLGCDSVLEFDGEIFGKPRDEQEARKRWERMAGCWGDLHTGHCLLPCPVSGGMETDPDPWLETVSTRVLFAPLDATEITAYVGTGEPLQCAGGFALEGRGALMVDRIDGCFSNVIGLSLPLLRRWMPRLLLPVQASQ